MPLLKTMKPTGGKRCQVNILISMSPNTANITFKQYRQCTYDVTLRSVRETIVAVERSVTYCCVCACAWMRACVCVNASVCVCMRAGVCLRACRLTYPVCHAKAPYCLRLSRLHHIFRHYLINGTIFVKKKATEYETCVFILSATFIWNIVILRRNQVDIVINVKTSSYKVPAILTRF